MKSNISPFIKPITTTVETDIGNYAVFVSYIQKIACRLYGISCSKINLSCGRTIKLSKKDMQHIERRIAIQNRRAMLNHRRYPKRKDPFGLSSLNRILRRLT